MKTQITWLIGMLAINARIHAAPCSNRCFPQVYEALLPVAQLNDPDAAQIGPAYRMPPQCIETADGTKYRDFLAASDANLKTLRIYQVEYLDQGKCNILSVSLRSKN